MGLVSGRRDTGGEPNVTQWIRLKRPVRILSSDCACGVVESMCEYRRAATAPPAECPVINKEHLDRLGSSLKRFRRRDATGVIIFFATVKKPA